MKLNQKNNTASSVDWIDVSIRHVEIVKLIKKKTLHCARIVYNLFRNVSWNFRDNKFKLELKKQEKRSKKKIKKIKKKLEKIKEVSKLINT